MDRRYAAQERFIEDFTRWFFNDGSVGGLETVVADNQSTIDLVKSYLDKFEKRT